MRLRSHPLHSRRGLDRKAGELHQLDYGPDRFSVQVERQAAFTRLVLEGELDLLHVPAVEGYIREIEEAGSETIVVDLSGLSFIDSTGLRALLGAHNRVTGNGDRFVLVPGPRFVQKVFTVTGLDGVFEFATAEDLADLMVERDTAADSA